MHVLYLHSVSIDFISHIALLINSVYLFAKLKFFIIHLKTNKGQPDKTKGSPNFRSCKNNNPVISANLAFSMFLKASGYGFFCM
jgi:hypothetical protein